MKWLVCGNCTDHWCNYNIDWCTSFLKHLQFLLKSWIRTGIPCPVQNGHSSAIQCPHTASLSVQWLCKCRQWWLLPAVEFSVQNTLEGCSELSFTSHWNSHLIFLSHFGFVTLSIFGWNTKFCVLFKIWYLGSYLWLTVAIFVILRIILFLMPVTTSLLSGKQKIWEQLIGHLCDWPKWENILTMILQYYFTKALYNSLAFDFCPNYISTKSSYLHLTPTYKPAHSNWWDIPACS